MSTSTKVVVWTGSDGMLNVTYPIGDPVETVQKRVVPDGIASYIIEKSTVPTDRTFRNAWTYTE